MDLFAYSRRKAPEASPEAISGETPTQGTDEGEKAAAALVDPFQQEEVPGCYSSAGCASVEMAWWELEEPY